MMRRVALPFTLALIAALAPAPAFAEDNVEAEDNAQAEDEMLVTRASSNWAANLEDGVCSLQRSYAAGDENIVIDLRRRAPLYNFEINVVSDTLSRHANTPLTQYRPDEEPLRHGFSFRLDLDEWEGFSGNLPANYFASDEEQSLKVFDAFERDVSMPLTNISGALAIMDQCLDEVVRSWGLDPDVQRSLSRVAQQSGDESDLVIEAIRRTQDVRQRLGQDSIRFVLIVGPDGAINSCWAEGEVGESGDAGDACATFRRAMDVEPALDAQGNPVESFLLIEGASYTRTQYIFGL